MFRREVWRDRATKDGVVPEVDASLIFHIDVHAEIAPHRCLDGLFLLSAHVVRIEVDEVVVLDTVRRIEAMELVPHRLRDRSGAEIPGGESELLSPGHDRDHVRVASNRPLETGDLAVERSIREAGTVGGSQRGDQGLTLTACEVVEF